MKLIVRILLAFVLVIVALGITIAVVVIPPSPLIPPKQGLTLENVTWIVPGQSRASNQRIVVEGSFITEVEPHEERPAHGAASDAAQAADFSGAFVMPGLTDVHVHFPPPSLPGQTELFAFLHLYHGVTAARDAGDVTGTASAPALEGIGSGAFAGPRLVSCGYFLDGPDPRWGNSIVVETPEQGRAAVRRVAAEGFECVKAYNGLDRDSLDAIREEAERLGLPVMGHTPRRVPYEQARLDDAQHLIGIPPPFDGEAPRFPLILEGWLRLGDERREAMIDAALEFGIANTPTLVTIDRLLATRDYEALVEEREFQLLPSFYRNIVWSPIEGISAARGLNAADFDMIEDAFEVMLETVKRMHERGVRLHSGTDTLVAFIVPGAALHRELRLLARAGLSPEEVLEISMVQSAQAVGGSKYGRIEPGAPAELVIFAEDPTRSLDALDSIVGVVRDGRLYTREMLDDQLDRYRAHFENRLYENLLRPLVRSVVASTAPD